MKKAGIFLVLSFVAFAASGDVGSSFDRHPFPDARLFGAYAVSSRPALYFSTREEFRPHGRVRVLIQTPSGWATAGEVTEDQHLRSQSVDLSRWGTSRDITVQLLVEAPGAAHVDSLLVDGRIPFGLDARLARKLAEPDNDVVPYTEVAGRPLTFPAGKNAVLTIVGRIEAAVIGTEPIMFPTENAYKQVGVESAFYRYRLGANRWSPPIDGSLKGESLGVALFKETFPLGSGHPESPTWAWIGNDSRFFYAAMDVTPDNTEDGTKDYAKVFLKSPDGVREFKITTAEQKWGKVGFEYTDKVGWEHKVYEFAIPLEELVTNAADQIELAFAAYGTLSISLDFDVSDVNTNGVEPDSGSSGTTFTFIVNYQDTGLQQPPNRSDVWIDLNGDGQEGAGPVAFPLAGAPPASIIIVFIAAGVAISLTSLRKRLGRAALVAVAAAALWACPPKTTQEVYTMTAGGSTWSAGVTMTAAVDLSPDPGTYDFEFKYKDSTGADVTNGSATGALQVTIY